MIIEREKLINAAERFKNEHIYLLMLLYRIQTSATKAINEPNAEQALRQLYESKQEVFDFYKALSTHAKWEQEAWYPLLREYCEEHLVPHAVEMLDTVEEDHYLAKMFVNSFITKLDRIVPPLRKEEVQNAAAVLNQTCHLLWEHFAREERLIEPVIDQVADGSSQVQ